MDDESIIDDEDQCPPAAAAAVIDTPAVHAAAVWLCDYCKVEQFPDLQAAMDHEQACPSRLQEEEAASPTAAAPIPEMTTVSSSSFFAPRSEKPKNRKEKADHNKSSNNHRGNVDVPMNAFFAPKTNQPSPTSTVKKIIKVEKNVSSASEVVVVVDRKSSKSSSQKGQKKKHKQASLPPAHDPLVVVEGNKNAPVKQSKITKKEKPTKRSSKTQATAAAAATTATSLTTSVERGLQETPQLASIFQHKSTKEIVAEQKQAEFQAKREVERRKELERQTKRAAMFGGGGEKQKSDAGGVVKGTGSNSCTTTTLPVKRKHAQQQTESTVDSRMTTNLHRTLSLAPRFPAPNHVGATNKKKADAEDNLDVLPSNHPLRRKSKEYKLESSSGSENPFRCVSLSSLDATDDNTVTPVQQILQTCLVPPDRSIADTTTKEKDARLWVDKYGMGTGLVGAAPTQTYHQLLEYVNHWRKLRKEAMERMAERQRKRKAKFDKAMGKKVSSVRKPKRKKKVYGSDEEDDFLDDDDCWDDDEFGNPNTPLCLLLGPPASGKTDMVHHVAKQSMCSVVEINTAEVRSGTALKNAVEEATKSTSLDTMLYTKENQGKAHFFPAQTTTLKRHVVLDSDDEDASGRGNGQSSMSQPGRDESSMAIVLIDEVDILFDAEGDSGFWAALTTLAKTAKSPIVLTANFCPPQLRNNSALPFRYFDMERPTPSECVSKLLQICRHEGIDVHPFVKKQGAEAIQNMLGQAAEACECDLRRMTSELQMFACAGRTKDNKQSDDVSTAKVEPSGSSNDTKWRPRIVTVKPRKVSMETHTVLTCKGGGFGVLTAVGDGFSVWVGDQKCKSRLVDDETLLILCPPFMPETEKDCDSFAIRLMKRILPISIDCPRLGLTKSTVQHRVVEETLVNGSSNVGSRRISIEYVFPDELEPSAANGCSDSDDECELQVGYFDPVAKPLSGLKLENEADGIRKWNEVLSKLPPDPTFSTSQQGLVNTQMAAALERESLHASYVSDAAFLEDFQDGVPYLSGACKGFGFDLTEECVGYSTQGDKLRLHENNRPPREEKLYEMGWKDTCYFYGDPETWVTTLSMKAGKEARASMALYRGKSSAEEQLSTIHTLAVPPEEIEDSEDIEFNAHNLCGDNEEDQYLPQPVPALLGQLPQSLRTIGSNGRSGLRRDLPEGIQSKIRESMSRVLSRASYILVDVHDRVGCTYGKFGLNSDKERDELILELMPALRRIGLFEQATEFAELEARKDAAVAGSSSRRTTRRQAKARRHHYFDKLSPTLRRDEADLNSSELGALMAQDMLVYLR